MPSKYRREIEATYTLRILRRNVTRPYLGNAITLRSISSEFRSMHRPTTKAYFCNHTKQSERQCRILTGNQISRQTRCNHIKAEHQNEISKHHQPFCKNRKRKGDRRWSSVSNTYRAHEPNWFTTKRSIFQNFSRRYVVSAITGCGRTAGRTFY